MKARNSRPIWQGLGTVAGLASGAMLIAPEPLYAQDPLLKPKADAMTTELPTVKVIGISIPSTNALKMDTGLDRLSAPLQSTPQTITVISQVVISQQQATTVDQVLKYVPGITVSTGEGNGGISGDQFRIRGFDASGDIYVDGLRDFGSYVRDSFATENVMVLKGPSSTSFGNGTTGGAIELQSKQAHLGNANSLDASVGEGPYTRGVLDINHQINGTTAVRAVVMGQEQNIVDRDHVYSNRAGFLGSIGFGLGTDQQFTLNYFHQTSNARPDFGVPMGGISTSISEPLTEYGIPRSTYYGRESDHDRMGADVLSGLYKGEFGDWLTLTNDTRVGYYTRNLKFTPSFCMDLPPFLASAYGVPPSNCASEVLAGNLNTDYTRWAVGGDKLTSYGGENVTTAVMRFDTWGLRHELVAGVDVYYQHQDANFYSPIGSGPSGTLLNPIFQNPPDFALNLTGSGIAAHSWDVGPFISDRAWLTSQLSVLGGVRWDHYKVEGYNAGTPIQAITNFASPKASVIWEPTPSESYYFSYSRSFTPPGSNITTLGSTGSLADGSTLNSLKPETATSYEFGGKWSLVGDRLGATAALFRVDKGNTSYIDPTSGIQTTTDDNDRVQGVELGLTGKIASMWDVQAAYSYQDSKIVSSAISTFNPVSAVGNRVPYVSKQNASLWTTYDLAQLIKNVHGNLLIGGGINYRSNYYVDDAMTMRIPAATTVDAMVSYDVNRYHVALNITNVTNKLAYSAAFGNGYATPVAGRTISLTAGVKF